MLDISLFRVPTFTGAQIVAFAISAAMFAQFLYLTLYLQNVLGYSPIQAGMRFLPLSLLSFVVAPISGRLSVRIPVRYPARRRARARRRLRFCLMHGITPSSSWTTLLAGFIVGGIGIGLVNPPLASTAVSVVPPPQAGMASGVNTTFRQVGIATGIAALGAILEDQIRSELAGTAAAPFAKAAAAGQVQVAAGRPAVAEAMRAAYISGLNEILLIAAIVAFVGAALAFVLVRRRDFVALNSACRSAGRLGRTRSTICHAATSRITAAPVTITSACVATENAIASVVCTPLAMRIAAPAPACVIAPAGAIGSAADAAEAQRKRERERERAVHRERVQEQEDRRAAERPRDRDEHPRGARLARAVRVPVEPAADAEPLHPLPAGERAEAARSRPPRATPATATTPKPARIVHELASAAAIDASGVERDVVEEAEHDQAQAERAEPGAGAGVAPHDGDANRVVDPARAARRRRRRPRRPPPRARRPPAARAARTAAASPNALKAYATRKRRAEAPTSTGSAWWSGQPPFRKRRALKTPTARSTTPKPPFSSSCVFLLEKHAHRRI